MTTTRERKEQFLHSFDDRTLDYVFQRLLTRHDGLGALSDACLDELVGDMIAHWRMRQRMIRRNCENARRVAS